MSGPAASSVSRSVLICATGFPRRADDSHKPFLLDHARALVDAGAAVVVLCPSAPGLPAHEEIGGVEVRRFRYAPRRWETLAYDGAMYRRVAGIRALWVPVFAAAFAVAAARLARRRRVDVVHGHWWAPTGAVAWLAARAAGAAAVVHLHGSDAAIARGPVRWLARLVLGRADAVVAVSDELAGWAGELGVGAAVVPMPVPVARLGMVDPAPAPSEGPVLGVGRLVPEKGFDVLVRAVARTGDRTVIVGEGPERDRLAALAAELGADVHLTGAVSPDGLAERYREARVVAVPSRREGFGMVAAEAAAMGRTVVGSRVGGLPALVDDGVSGVLCPPGDVDRLVEALDRATPGMGAHGPAQVAHLRPPAHAAALAAVYEGALSDRGGREGRAGRRGRRR